MLVVTILAALVATELALYRLCFGYGEGLVAELALHVVVVESCRLCQFENGVVVNDSILFVADTEILDESLVNECLLIQLVNLSKSLVQLFE